jgi:hypothetical protein
MWWAIPDARGEKMVRSVPRSRWQLELRALDALAYLVVADAQRCLGRSPGRIVDRGNLLLAILEQPLRLGCVVAVAIDDHGVLIS